MTRIELISFDAEGTLVTPDFSEMIWHEAIPALYAQKKGLDLAQAKKCITEEYNKVGVNRLEWYDIEYWFSRLDLGSSEPVIRSCLSRISYYPEITDVVSSLATEYKLIVASGTPLELLHCLLRDIKPYFVRIFSSVSHYKQVKTPDFYLRICEEMSVKPGQVIHVGDSWQFDFLNARQAGLNAFYIDRSGENHQESLSDLTQLKQFLVPSA
ncbi:MAG: HAD family hydrolase [Dehalococcoidia bacterium]|nr:HAD family hydrolase [Dehalococcoidia bacterium]MDH4299521.1 HAD family hydrolase [Dehalococcoidia bacterium]MDH4367386.1 HAD family hydrolase [Dehalococcoidia bacterium]